MIRKFRFGNPYKTEALVTDIHVDNGDIPYLNVTPDGRVITLALEEDDKVFGLGEQIRGINKRGWHYNNWNHDNPHHQEDTTSLYGSHNFLIVSGSKLFGIFIDNPSEVEFDIGYKKRELMEITIKYTDYDLYIIEGKSNLDIISEFRSAIGKSYIAPKWAFGYGQSRWGYKNEDDIREVRNNYKKAGIPLDSIYMDIDYMDDYKDFTVDKNRFPDLKNLASDMKKDNIHLVPIIDAGVKIKEGYDVYEEGVEKGYFCKNEDGKDFIGAVWPGKVHFPDFLKEDVRKWFGYKYKALTDLGIDGFWNDMNEPSIFYTEKNLEDALNKAASLKGRNIGIVDYFDFVNQVSDLNGNRKAYDEVFHLIDGELVPHTKVHNLYGMNMTRAASEALNEINPEEETLFFSRSSYIGAHRYGGIWQGDNKSWWGHILQAMKQLPALNMCGFMFVGCDVGGFGSDTTEDLMMRFLQYSIFTPLFRNHSADGTRRQELYQFGNVDDLGKMIRIRYALIPYLYSEYLRAIKDNTLMFKPLGFEFTEDKMALEVEDQLLIGNELMIAPIYEQNAKGRYVYLPEEMMLIRMTSPESYETVILNKGHHYINADLNELTFFIRKDKAISWGQGNPQNVMEIDYSNLTKLGYDDYSYKILK